MNVVLPAYCRVHGVFPYVPLAWGPNVTLRDNFTDCPVCGEFIPVLSGDYTAIDNTYRIINDGNFTDSELRAILDIINRANAQNLTQDEVRAEAAKISPKVASFFDISNWNDTAKATLLSAVLGGAAILGAAVITSSAPSPHPPSVTTNVFIEKVVQGLIAAAPPRRPVISSEPPLRPRPRPKSPRR